MRILNLLEEDKRIKNNEIQRQLSIILSIYLPIYLHSINIRKRKAQRENIPDSQDNWSKGSITLSDTHNLRENDRL